jgi:YidC/Oxa1 family membrane protein insertase
MDRKSIIGIVLIALIFIVWGVINKPSAEELARRKYVNDSIAAAGQTEKRLADSAAALPQNNTTEVQTTVVQEGSGTPAQTAIDTNRAKTITLENDLIKVFISERGGRPSAVELKKYMRYDSVPIRLFDADSSSFGLNYFDNNQPVNTKDLYFKAPEGTDSVIVLSEPQSVILRHSVDKNNYIDFRYTLAPGRYQVDLDIEFAGMKNIITPRTGIIDLTWMIMSPQQEKGRDNEMQYTTLYYKNFEEDVEYLNARSKKPIQEKNLPTRIEWIAYKDQFFSSVLLADTYFTDAKMQTDQTSKHSKYLKKFESIIGLPFEKGNKQVIPLHFYFGPNKFKLLKKQYGDKQLQDLVSVGRGIIKWINQIVIIKLFDFLNRFIRNYGIIILIMTIIIKVVLLPLTFKSYMSTAKMKVLKPQIDAINAKIPKEKAMERQQATMALYKKVGVSPLGGCLPMLLQMPILFAMFRFFPTSIELRQQSFLWATDLSTYDAFIEWHRNIPIISSIFGNHLSLFTLLMTLSTIVSMQMSGQTNMSNQQMPGMKGMMYIMPVMFMFILNKFSAALTYYYFLANVITIGQNYLFKQFIDEEELLKKLESRKAKPQKKSKFTQRLEELAKQQGYRTPKKR